MKLFIVLSIFASLGTASLLSDETYNWENDGDTQIRKDILTHITITKPSRILQTLPNKFYIYDVSELEPKSWMVMNNQPPIREMSQRTPVKVSMEKFSDMEMPWWKIQKMSPMMTITPQTTPNMWMTNTNTHMIDRSQMDQILWRMMEKMPDKSSRMTGDYIPLWMMKTNIQTPDIIDEDNNVPLWTTNTNTLMMDRSQMDRSPWWMKRMMSDKSANMIGNTDISKMYYNPWWMKNMKLQTPNIIARDSTTQKDNMQLWMNRAMFDNSAEMNGEDSTNHSDDMPSFMMNINRQKTPNINSRFSFSQSGHLLPTMMSEKTAPIAGDTKMSHMPWLTMNKNVMAHPTSNQVDLDYITQKYNFPWYMMKKETPKMSSFHMNMNYPIMYKKINPFMAFEYQK